jgi:hypothetical protein
MTPFKMLHNMQLVMLVHCNKSWPPMTKVTFQQSIFNKNWCRIFDDLPMKIVKLGTSWCARFNNDLQGLLD